MRKLIALPVLSLVMLLVPMQYAWNTPVPSSPAPGVTLHPTLQDDLIPRINFEAKAEEPVPEIPVRLEIPSISLNSEIVPVTLNTEKIVDTPERDTGWYSDGVKPGENGTAALNGHYLNADQTRGVFYRLGEVKTGDEISLTDAKNQVLLFRVIENRTVDLAAFPVGEVYGSSDRKLISLTTCAGKYVASLDTYNQRVIVWAELI